MEPLDRPASLAARVANNLRQELRSEYVVGGQLPSEPELAAQLGVSRGTVRQALTMLEREGMIIRRQGAGTYVHYISRVQTRVEHAYEFSDLLRIAGFEPSIQLISFENFLLAEEMAVQLDVEPGTEALVVRKLFLANSQPAIYCLDFIPQYLIIQPYTETELQPPIFDFLQQRCGQATVQNLAEIIPEVTSETLAALLNMESGQPLLRIDEVGYNEEGAPVIFTRAYYRDQFIRFSVLRKRI
jgi:GntR family transcriptional regulator